MIDPKITDRITGRELWTAQQCADHCNITRPGWASGSARGSYPAPAGDFHVGKVWWADEVIAWRKEHPGRK
ncbi:hypothetical protein [Corynebacterium aquilae]|uniref:hypothetical protein n=1 Tax=Corynebacterium aquilae TaxID=203263 RepID=UPI0012EE35C0|nr:hypothetical protein [Corynebacterium aquilae]